MRKSSLTSIADSLIPKPNGIIKVVKQDFDTKDIIRLILFADKANDNQAAKEVARLAPRLKGQNDFDTLKNIWSFVRFEIKYIGDPIDYEDVKLPSEVWNSGFADCKSKSIFVAALLKAFPQFGIRYRFAAYDNDSEFTHVYVIVDTQDGFVIVDPVHTRFNEEVTFSDYKDYKVRELRFIHGPKKVGVAPAVRSTSSLPSINEAFNDGPKKSINLPSIPIDKLTQGQILLELADQKYMLLQAYYGDINGMYTKARNLIANVKRSGLQNANLKNITLPNEFKYLVSLINEAKNKHISEIVARSQTSVSVSGWIEDARACVNKFRPSEATAEYRNGIFNRHYVNVDYTQKIDGVHYLLDNPEFRICYEDLRKRDFARLHFFDSDNFVKGSHHILYKFLPSSEADLYSPTLAAKAFAHKLAIGGMSNLSALDETVCTQYLENALIKNSARINLVDITPKGSIDLLKENGKNLSIPKIGNPLAVVLGAISAAITAITGLINSLDATQKVAFQSSNPGFGNKQYGPLDDDFKKIESQSNNSLIVGGLIGATALGLLFTNKN